MSNRLGSSLRQAAANVQAFDMPSAALYDRLAGWFMDPFYSRVALEVAATCPVGNVLDVGCGPGHLVFRLARLRPDLHICGVDLMPSMIRRASRRAGLEGLAPRVRFAVGDVVSLPFEDGHFHTVVTTLSMHHWPDPLAGIAEMRRVVRPGGVCLIYDIPAWLDRLTHYHPRRVAIAPLVPPGAPLAGARVEYPHWTGLLPAVRVTYRRPLE